MFRIKDDRGHLMMRTDVRDVLNAMMMAVQDERDVFVLVQVAVALGMTYEGPGCERIARRPAVHVLRHEETTANSRGGSTPPPLSSPNAVVKWQPKGR